MHPYTTAFAAHDEAPTLTVAGQSVTRLVGPGRTNGHYALDRMRLARGATQTCGGDNDPLLRGWYVVSGEAALDHGGEKRVLDDGAFALLPMESAYSITVTSETIDLLRFELPASRRKMPRPVFSHRDEAPARWNVGILWIMLAIDEETADHFCLIEELLPRGEAAPIHVHEWMDEGFYLLDGEATFQVGDTELRARAGSFLSVPMGTPHAFHIDSGTARLLNWYTPPGFEHVLMELGVEAAARTLPPPGLPPVDMRRAGELFERWGQTNLFDPGDFGLNTPSR